MLSAILIASAIAARAPSPLVAATAVAVVQPGWFLGGAAALAVVARARRDRGAGPDAEAAVLLGIAAELRAGASLRSALAGGASRAPGLPLAQAVRFAAAGRPMAEVAEELRRALPHNGRLAAAALELTAATGARSAEVFARLAERATTAGELARERRALSAQARLSAWLVGGAPVAFVAVMMLIGPGLTGAGVLIPAGVGLIAAGGAVVWWMVRRAER